MNQAPTCDVSWVEALLGSDPFETGYLLAPEDMLAEIAACRRLYAAAQSACPEVTVDWADVYAEDYPQGRFVDLIDGLSDPDQRAAETIFNYLLALIAAKEKTSVDDLDESMWERVGEFMEDPSADVAARTGIDVLIPNVVDLMREIEAARQYHFALWVCQNNPAPLLLRGTVDVSPKQPGLLAGDLELWVWVAPDSNNIEHTAPDIFVISASLVHRPPAESAELVAFVGGKLVPMFMNYSHVFSDDIFEIMDAHSAMLNDVWKTIQGEFLPALGLDEFDELSDMFLDDEAPGAAICVPWICVHEKFRGCELSKVMLKAVANASQDVGSWCHSDTITGKDGSEADEEDETTGDLPTTFAMLADNPIRLFVLPIEGTRPADTEFANPWARGDLGKDAPRKVVDMKVEQRRKGLENYFLHPESAYESFFVHAYNPWDYPIT